jgi:hypothetical protein
MVKICINIPDDLAEKFRQVAALSPGEAVTDAFHILTWAVDETARGRLIMSSEADGKNIQHVTMPSLQEVSRRRRNWLPKPPALP